MSLDSLEPGTHLCAFHRSPGQLTRIAATFIGQGLAAGDQLLYVTTDEQAEAVLRALPGPRATRRPRSRASSWSARSRRPTAPVGPTTSAPSPTGSGPRPSSRASAASPASASPPRWTPSRRCSARPTRSSRWERMSTGLQREIGVSSVCLYDADLLDDGATRRCVAARARRLRARGRGEPARPFPRGRRAVGPADQRRGRHLQPRHAAPDAPVARGRHAPDARGPRGPDVRRRRQPRPDRGPSPPACPTTAGWRCTASRPRSGVLSPSPDSGTSV